MDFSHIIPLFFLDSKYLSELLLCILWQKIVLGYFRYLQMIEYFRINIRESIPVYPGSACLVKSAMIIEAPRPLPFYHHTRAPGREHERLPHRYFLEFLHRQGCG
jgi:hypothetical protein